MPRVGIGWNRRKQQVWELYNTLFRTIPYGTSVDNRMLTVIAEQSVDAFNKCYGHPEEVRLAVERERLEAEKRRVAETPPPPPSTPLVTPASGPLPPPTPTGELPPMGGAPGLGAVLGGLMGGGSPGLDPATVSTDTGPRIVTE